jgi:ribonuclease HII
MQQASQGPPSDLPAAPNKRPRRPAASPIKTRPTFDEEDVLKRQGYVLVAGVDEVGRGPLAGPVVAAAVVLPDDWSPPPRPSRRRKGGKAPRRKPDLEALLNDSKLVTRLRREALYQLITARAVSYGVAFSSREAVDDLGIVGATRQAMRQAVAALKPQPNAILVDAIDLSEAGLPCRWLYHGDALCVSIAAASIVAKVVRDRHMDEMDSQYPGYGFARHKGYGTREHVQRLRELGPCLIHRRSFAPVRELLMRQPSL